VYKKFRGVTGGFAIPIKSEVDIQRRYYGSTATQYEEMHSGAAEENRLALGLLSSAIDLLAVASVLEVGAGTGRAIRRLKEAKPRLRLVGLEPSQDLRRHGYDGGLSPDELIEGDAQQLPFENGSFDIVFELAALHHMPRPDKAVAEMLRVARVAIFISDSNNFGQGGYAARRFKQLINALGLWHAFDLMRTRGRGYHWSEGDGLFYSYSVFNDLPLIREHCSSVHVMNTTGASVNHYRDAPSVALFGIKRA
jgi:SAM-dependent methyltransferase